jgi:hypothetical protein
VKRSLNVDVHQVDRPLIVVVVGRSGRCVVPANCLRVTEGELWLSSGRSDAGFRGKRDGSYGNRRPLGGDRRPEASPDAC